MKYLLTLLLLSTTFIACTKTEEIEIIKDNDGPKFEKAITSLHPIGDSGVAGTVTFELVNDGVKVTAEVTGLGNSAHGFHIHQYGDCTASDGTSAGGHFNPTDMDHSGPDAMERHMGDMGNLQGAGKNAVTTYSYVDTNIKLSKIMGRGVIIHADEDDLVSQPTGAAGARIACGVIGVAK